MYREVRLVGEGRNEIVTPVQAFAAAEDLGLDLVLVSDKSTPPVVKIEDFKKLEFQTVYHLNTGMTGWERAGKPVAK